MDNTTTNVQGSNYVHIDDPELQNTEFTVTTTSGDTSGEVIYNPVKRRKSISYKSELEKMEKERDKWRVRTIAIIALYVISLIIKIIAS